jgi:DHA3 family tetracycline resistance protein-like MFS transporter
VQVAGIVGLAVSPVLGLAMAGLWVRQAAQNVAYPVQTAWLNRNVPSGSRATVMSMSSQVDAVGQVVGGPSIAAVGSRLGLTAALLTSAVVLSPAVAVYLLVRRVRTSRDGGHFPDTQVREPETGPTPAENNRR